MNEKRIKKMFNGMRANFLEIKRDQARTFYQSRKNKRYNLNKREIHSTMTVTQLMPGDGQEVGENR